ncbi:DUF6308 family protein [Pseudarthrobacter sp. PH31-O2]|uniref:DUF6308 family protein n=1 Tax=Pseudarthrobacter sp. PH31-O2 TaxID=3046206 RepID=UPI0024BB7E92|nr:DUF6308 family protein [Pseudarthrobacter sp. PH31-O2]MDJ0354411.1 DUF6308 family protein [Pseudarthrobacter sp. PH31-O2]
MTTTITVGGLTTDLSHANTLASEYMNQYGSWSYPAYDSYQGNGERDTVGPQDTLAVALLNAGQNPVGTQYTFLGLLDEINVLLRDGSLTGTLDEAGPETLEAIARLYGVLDGKRNPNVRLTKLSKALHLKRPQLLPLYDKNIWQCYGELGKIRVASIKGRNNADFMRAWLPEVQKDLRDGMEHWRAMAALAPGPTVSPLRVLDIVGWRLADEARRGCRH